MNIQEFKTWMESKGFINPVVEPETTISMTLKSRAKERKTGKTISTFISPTGVIIIATYTASGTIIRVASDNYTEEMI